MRRLADEIVRFFHNQGCVIVSTVDSKGIPHSACKGIVGINTNGRVYLLDLYRAKTYENLKRNPRMSITAVDEYKFTGYSLKGKAGIMPADKIPPKIIKAWEERITTRLTKRVLKNIQEDKRHGLHPEALLPKPQYLIAMEVKEVVNLTPHHLK